MTIAGEFYAREIREALRKISTASFNLRANPRGGTLNLAILPTFGTRWLAPRLPKFLAQNPGVTINLATRLMHFDFGAEGLDAAIHFGPGDAADLKKAPLLSISTGPNAWNQRFSAQSIAGGSGQTMYFDQFATVAQATM